MAETSIVIAKSTGGQIGQASTDKDSVAVVGLKVPCYKAYSLKYGDSDSAKRWGGQDIGEVGTWVTDLQNDLLSLGIGKYGLIVEHTTPRPPKKITTTTLEPVIVDGKPVLRKGKPVNKKVVKITEQPQPDKIDYWEKVTLAANGDFDKATVAALKLFQWHALKVGKRMVGGSEVTVSISFSGAVTGTMDELTCAEIKTWKAKNYKLIGPALSGYAPKVDFDKFVQLYESCPPASALPFIALSAPRKEGLQDLLNRIAADKEISDIRWAAYMLATAIHECRNLASSWKATWSPVSETPNSNGTYGPSGKYGDEEFVVNHKGEKIGADGNPLKKGELGIKRRYYGRGYVQITWQENYRRFDDALSMGHLLHINPEKALEKDVAYRIMSHGMRNGGFTTKKLSDYLTGATTDYFNARSIINTDKSETPASNPTIAGSKLSNGKLIAYYADIFEWIVYNSMINS